MGRVYDCVTFTQSVFITIQGKMQHTLAHYSNKAYFSILTSKIIILTRTSLTTPLWHISSIGWLGITTKPLHVLQYDSKHF